MEIEDLIAQIKRHGQEWKNLFAAEIESRQKLSELHEIEKKDLVTESHNYTYVAKVLIRQISEIAILKNINNERRERLRSKQFHEKLLQE